MLEDKGCALHMVGVGSIPGGYKQSSPMPEIQQAMRRLASTQHLPLAYRLLMA